LFDYLQKYLFSNIIIPTHHDINQHIYLIKVVVVGLLIPASFKQGFKRIDCDLVLAIFHEGKTGADHCIFVFHRIRLRKAKESILLLDVELAVLSKGKLSD
jgi:hypothetical protein